MRISKNLSLAIFCCVVSVILPLQAAAAGGEQSQNMAALTTFFVFVSATLGITWFAAKKTKDQSTFFAAGGGIPAWQNGMAIAGDFMSAATLLGITGLMYFSGFDGYILAVGTVVAWPILLMLVAEKFRNLGRYTFVDVITYRLHNPSLRILSATASLMVVIFYLIGQMVGAGKLIELLFGLEYVWAVSSVTILMMCYVIFGGMIATTWVQMIKAVLLLAGGVLIAFLLLKEFNFNFGEMISESTKRHPKGEQLLAPGGWLQESPLQVLTVGLTMCFGILGLPHILMRFFTVKDASSARSSVTVATMIMALFYALILVLGFGAVALVWGEPSYLAGDGSLIGGSNLVALHLASAVGGDLLLGYMSAVTFATILAVVAGLTLAGSATIAHDLIRVFGAPPKSGSKSELNVTRAAALGIGILALLLGIAFEEQNIAVVTVLALAVAASVNFPILILAMYWRGLSSRGALFGGAITLVTCLGLIILSDSVWVQVLGNEAPLVPLIYPTVVTLPLGFISIILCSLLDRSADAQRERGQFDEQYYRSITGIGASNATKP